MSECLSEAWRGYPRVLPRSRILMGGFEQSAQPRGFCILPEDKLRLYCFPTSMALGSVAIHGSSPHHLFFVTQLFPGFSTGGLSLYVTDDSIHKPPKYPETLITTFDQLSLFRFMATNNFE